MTETKDKVMPNKPPWFLLGLITVVVCVLVYFFPWYTITTLKWVVIILGGGVVLSIPSLIVTGLLTNFFERPLVGKVGGLAVGLVIAAILWWLWHRH